MAQGQAETSYNPELLKQRGLWLTVGRMFFLLVVFFAILTDPDSPKFSRPYLDIALVISMVAAVLLFMVNFPAGRHRWFQVLQTIFDLLVASALVFFSGGVHSPLVFLFYGNLMGTAFVLTNQLNIAYASIAIVVLAAKMIADIDPKDSTHELIMNVPLLVGHAIALVVLAFAFWSMAKKHRRDKLYDEDVLQNITDAILVVSSNGRLRFLNPAAKRLLGLTSQDRNQQLDEVLKRAGFGELCGRVADTDDDSFRIGISRPGGKKLQLEVKISRIEREEGSGKILVIEDFSPALRLQELESRQRRLADYSVISAGVAHEIRNPLASIKSAAEQLGTEFEDPDMVTLAKIIASESDRINATLTNFLKFAKTPAPVRRAASVPQLLREVRATVLAQCQPEVTYNIVVDEELTATLDANQIRQVLLNLGLNSVQATDAPVTIDVTARHVRFAEVLPLSGVALAGHLDGRQEGVHFTHSDDGPGIPEDARPGMFVPFSSKKPGGSGLGLAIAQRIADEHGGVLFPEFDLERGVRFHLWIPDPQRG